MTAREISSNDLAQRSYPARLLLAFLSSFVVVYLAMVAVGGEGHDLTTLSLGALIYGAVAIICSAISASIFKRDVPLILSSQLTAVSVAAALNFWA